MSTLIVGGGLMGLTAAYVLASRGEDVTLLEAQSGVALESSFANGGMFTPSMPEPWNSPGVSRYLAASLFNPRSSMKLRVSAIPSLFTWGIRFLRHSSLQHYEAACADNYALATYSLEKSGEISEALDLDYCRGTQGTLSVFRNRADFEEKEAVCRHLAGLGMAYDVLDVAGMLKLVPALEDIREEIYNGILYPADEYGDAHLFCRALEPHFVQAGGTLRFDTSVESLVVDGRRVVGVRTPTDLIEADRIVIAAGTRSTALLATAGVPLGVRPVKGYSVTVDVSGISDVPTLPVLDDSMHAGMTPLGNRLRMVGTAEFTGFDTTINPVRTDNLYAMFEAMLPGIARQVDRAAAKPWAGLRPMSYDGKPFIGATKLDGLYVKLRAGSSRLDHGHGLGPPAGRCRTQRTLCHRRFGVCARALWLTPAQRSLIMHSLSICMSSNV